MTRIFSYETLFEKWLFDKQLKNIVVIGQNLRHDREGFLYDNPNSLIQLAANQNDIMMFYAIIHCYEPSELDTSAKLSLTGTQEEMIDLYKDSMLDAVDGCLAKEIFGVYNTDLWGW